MKCLCCYGEGYLHDVDAGYSLYNSTCQYCKGTGKTSLLKWLIWKYDLWTLDWIVYYKIPGLFRNKEDQE